MQHWATALQARAGLDKGHMSVMECGLRGAVGARTKGRRDEQEQWRQGEQGQRPGKEQSKQGKQVRFGEEEQLRETRAKSTDESEVMGRLAEVRTGRGSSGLVRGGDERCRGCRGKFAAVSTPSLLPQACASQTSVAPVYASTARDSACELAKYDSTFALDRAVSTNRKETIYATSSIAELPRKFPRDFPGAALPR